MLLIYKAITVNVTAIPRAAQQAFSEQRQLPQCNHVKRVRGNTLLFIAFVYNAVTEEMVVLLI